MHDLPAKRVCPDKQKMHSLERKIMPTAWLWLEYSEWVTENLLYLNQGKG